MKLNYKNIGLMVVLVILVFMVIADLITIATSISQYTWFGIATTLLTLYGIAKILEYFDEYTSKRKVSAHNRYDK